MGVEYGSLDLGLDYVHLWNLFRVQCNSQMWCVTKDEVNNMTRALVKKSWIYQCILSWGANYLTFVPRVVS